MAGHRARMKKKKIIIIIFSWNRSLVELLSKKRVGL